VPFCAETPVATFWKHLRERPMPPSHLNPAIPRSVDLVILHALEKDPRRRFHSPLALAHAYRRALRSSQTAHDDAWESGEAQESSFAFNFPESAAPLPVLDPPARVGQGEQRKQQEEILVLPALPTLSAPSTDSLEQAESLQEDDGSNPAYPVTTSATIPMEGMGEQRTSPVDTPFAASDLTGLASTHSLQPPATRQRSRPPRPTTMRRRHRKRNPVIVAATVGVGFLLLVALLMSFVYVTAVSRQEAVATATVQEMTTAAAQSARATAEAHAQATATASVLTNVTATTPILSDALLGNTAGRWPENDNCRFMKGPPDTPTIHLGVRRPHEGVERS
jgi:hypothetical protein